uniref:NADH-ubiquinone oxidoreductase chain 6 n=1 Tax=Prasinoderma coloniale TaxID=156133 RepID=V9PAM7_9VIRI|nr:NADH dehydrogenase subunit 6 [Prasinoderma coloniale]AGW52215.1 NADH dehydrogenase subunit 6 [Prasinoderma coloniale]
MTTVSFYLLGLIGLVSAFSVVWAHNPVHSVLALVAAFAGGGCICLLMDLDFFGLTLLVVYVGAISVLFLFVIMMLNLKEESISLKTAPSLLIGLTFIALFYYILHSALMPTFPTPGEILSGHIGPDPLGLINILPEVEDQTTLVTVGIQLFGAKIAEVMIASGILLVAMVGAIHLTLEKNAHTKTQNPVSQMMRDASRSTVKYAYKPSQN